MGRLGMLYAIDTKFSSKSDFILSASTNPGTKK